MQNAILVEQVETGGAIMAVYRRLSTGDCALWTTLWKRRAARNKGFALRQQLIADRKKRLEKTLQLQRLSAHTPEATRRRCWPHGMCISGRPDEVFVVEICTGRCLGLSRAAAGSYSLQRRLR
jgi:hypothetical protein